MPSAPVRLLLSGMLAVMLAACEQPEPENAEEPNPTPSPSVANSLPAVMPGLSRADLITAMNQAASDYAGGIVRDGTDPLVGRTFSVSAAFGCGGPVTASMELEGLPGLPRAAWGPERQTIELQMTPADWADSALIAGALDESQWEAVEGFWLPRPWFTSERCPLARDDLLNPVGAAASAQTMGIAAIFEEGGSRIGRRNGRPYSFTVRSEGDAPLAASAQGYRLVLEGRTVAFADGRAVRCQASSAESRPVCVVATRLDRVAFEEANGTLLVEWRPD